MIWGFVGTIDRLARDFWRAAQEREQQREQAEARSLAAVRDAERAHRALEDAPAGDDVARAKLYTAWRQAEAAAQSARARQALALLDQLLPEGLARDVRIPPAELRARATSPQLDTKLLPKITVKPEWESFAPEKPGRLALAMPGASARFEALVAKARSEFVHAEREHEASKIRRTQGSMILQLAQQKAAEAARNEASRQNAAVAEFEGALLRGEPDAIAGFARLVLSRSPYPAGFMQTLAARYLPEGRLLAIGYDVPALDGAVPVALEYRYDGTEDAIRALPLNDATRAASYASMVRQVVLRSLRELFAVDPLRNVDAIVFNVYADGGEGRVCLASAHVARTAFAALNLSEGEAAGHLASLGVQLSAAPEALQGIAPVIAIDMTRVVTDADVAVDRRLNLMTLPEKDFTQVMFHLLRSQGLEGPPLLPGEGGMLTCRAWDPHPIFGGDVVVHLRRQLEPLDLPAARALLAEMQSIGAARGMLMTTGGSEAGVEEFAQNHRIELLEGHHLVFMMMENAGVSASVEVPADRQASGTPLGLATSFV